MAAEADPATLLQDDFRFFHLLATTALTVSPIFSFISSALRRVITLSTIWSVSLLRADSVTRPT